MHFSKALQGSKSAITMSPVLIESTLLLFNRDLNRGCFVYVLSLRLSGSKFLINLRRQFRVRKTFRT